MDNDWVKVADVAKHLGVRLNTVYRLIDLGKLPAKGRRTTIGRANGDHVPRKHGTLVRRADLERFIEAARIQPGDLQRLHPRKVAEQGTPEQS